MSSDDQKLKEVGIGTPEMVRMFKFKSPASYYKSPRKKLYKAAVAEVIRLTGEHLSK